MSVIDRIAIISDIHGNITALEAVLKDIETRGITKIFCLGDIVLKCANPDKVIDLVREKCEVVLKGNCDDLISKPSSIEHGYWTAIKIGKDRCNYLYDLPVFHEFYISGYLMRLFHSSPLSLEHVFNPMYDGDGPNYIGLKITDPSVMFKNTPFIGKTNKDKFPDIVRIRTYPYTKCY